MSDRAVADETLASLADLAEAAGEFCQLLDQVFGGAVPLAHVRDAGRLSLVQVLPPGKQLKVIGDICAASANLADARNRFRRAAARSLYGSDFTMEEIARELGVTRQRVSALVRQHPKMSRDATQRSRRQDEAEPTGSLREVIERSYEWTLLRHAAGKARPAPDSPGLRMKALYSSQNRRVDETLASLADLAEAAGKLCQLLDQVFGGAVPLAHVRDAGRLSLVQVVPPGKQLKVIGDICAASANLADARNRFRRAAARSLYGSDFTMEEIARELGVTRQRVSAIVRQRPEPGSAATAGSRPGK